jgi:23S rRNA pseudouridine1911/1915/1917 synthase
LAFNSGFKYHGRVGAEDGGLTLLEYLARHYRHSTVDEWRKRIEGEEITLDSLPGLPGSAIRPGQEVAWQRPPWNEPDAPLDYALLYQDDDLLATAKPSGLPTMPGGGFLDHTLLALVRKDHPEATPIHRLGRGTSGIVLFARSQRARSRLSEALRQNRAIKVYRALAKGIPPEHAFSIETPIGPVPHPLLGTIHAACKEGKHALSRARILERRENSSLLEVSIETGKPHQIRIHLAAAGYPLVGDPLFTTGGGFLEPATALPGDLGYLLHAERLRIPHPATLTTIEFWCCPPPGLRAKGESR